MSLSSTESDDLHFSYKNDGANTALRGTKLQGHCMPCLRLKYNACSANLRYLQVREGGGAPFREKHLGCVHTWFPGAGAQAPYSLHTKVNTPFLKFPR